ncbi:MAG: hypothetical protein HY646_06305 [Acidobacteria bacterium]|nr:hypothetical protein [Acidobacteriota bacterium]
MRLVSKVSSIGVALLVVTMWVSAFERSIEVSLPLQNGLRADASFDVDSDARTYKVELTESPGGHASIVLARIARFDGQPFELGGFALKLRVSSRRG